MNEDITINNSHLTRAIIELGEIRPVIAKQAIFNNQGIKILEQGAAIHAGLYERLTAHNLSRPIEESVTAEGQVDGRALRDGITRVLETEAFYARMTPSEGERQRLLDIIEKVPLPEPVAFQLTLARETRPRLYDNALRAAWTMAWLAREGMETQFDIGMAAAAGLLHDLGMLHLNPVLMDHRAELTRELRRELYSHPIVSHVLIERHHVYPKVMLDGVLQHHEHRNGSGYPRNLKGSQISTTGQRLAITDLLVAMISAHDDGGEMRLGVLLRMNMHRYGKDLIDSVLALLQPGQDPRSEAIATSGDPAALLAQAHDMLQACPRDASRFAGITAARREAWATLREQVDELGRTLAEAGLTPSQLEQLGSAAMEDAMVHRELTLLAREAAWQLHALARQARRRWSAGRDGVFPQEILDWTGRVEQFSQAVRSGPQGQGLPGHFH